jgi:hypothetical protein
MSYQLFTDREELFEAKIKLSGASLKESFCRLVVESEEWNIVFKGTIDSKGNCSIPIKKLKNVMSEGLNGTMKLEVIAEDTYFVPWESEFEVETSKSVQVEVKQQTNKKAKVVTERVKPQASATVVTKQKPKKSINLQESSRKVHLKNFTKQLMSEGATLSNIRQYKSRINELSNQLIFEHNISEDARKWIVNNTLKILAKKAKK